ncbi:MAG TPA: hypothetical protein VJ943_00045 [Desulfotignum sp.]|nr:hypothetical protein [Desulfotignum sp.]
MKTVTFDVQTPADTSTDFSRAWKTGKTTASARGIRLSKTIHIHELFYIQTDPPKALAGYGIEHFPYK